MKESDLQKKIIKYFQAKGGYAINVVQASKAGVPDIVGCLHGRFYGIEVKLPGKKASPLQDANLKIISKSKGVTIVAHSIEDVKKVIEKQLEKSFF